MAEQWLIPRGELLERRKRYRVAALPGCKTGGIHADVWLPTTMNSSASPIGTWHNLDPLTMTVVFVHGGGWMMGAAHDISSAEIEYYNAKGFIVVSLEYRLLPQ